MDMKIARGVLDVVGNTPLVQLERALPGASFQLLAKLEGLNPAGSAKDRPARSVIRHALESGLVAPGGVVVESSSGNMGIGLAQACAYHGLRFICVVDSKTTVTNRQLLEAYGAELELVEQPDPETGELLQARLNRVHQLLQEHPGAHWPNQYANEQNSSAHFRTTMREIDRALQGRVDFLFVATSTCGTLRGCWDYIRTHGLSTRLIAVDAAGSRIFEDAPRIRRIPGLGAGIVPPLFPGRDQVPLFEHVTDVDCVVGCRRLVRREALLVGGSSGGVFTAVERWAERIPAGANCVAIFPDRGERYLDTVFNDRWVRDELGEIFHFFDGGDGSGGSGGGDGSDGAQGPGGPVAAHGAGG
jgi:cysteine synthase A